MIEETIINMRKTINDQQDCEWVNVTETGSKLLNEGPGSEDD